MASSRNQHGSKTNKTNKSNSTTNCMANLPVDEAQDQAAVENRVGRLMEELAVVCDDQNHVLTSDSLQFIATQYGTEPIKLEPEVKEIEKPKALSKKSGVLRSNKDSIRRQRVEELTRFFMEGKSHFELDFSRSSRDSDVEQASEKDIIDSKEMESTDTSSFDDEVLGSTDPKVIKARQHQLLLQEKVDSAVFNNMLLSIRETEPLLYGAILCHPLVFDHDSKKEKKKKKKKDKLKEKESVEKDATMLSPDFASPELTSSETALNVSRFVARAIKDGSIQSLLLALKLVFSVATAESYASMRLQIASHLRVLAGKNPPQMPEIQRKEKKTDPKRKNEKEQSQESVASIENEFSAISSMDLDNEEDAMTSLTARLSRFVNQSEESSSSSASFEASASSGIDEEVSTSAGMDEEALMAQAIALSLSSEMDVSSPAKKEDSESDATKEVAKEEGDEKVQVDMAIEPRPAPFSAEEMRRLCIFEVTNDDENADLLTTAIYIISRIADYCTKYIETVRKGILEENSAICPKPLTFLLLHSLMQQMDICPISQDPFENARWKLVKACGAFTFLRALEVNFFYIDVTDLAPASVGLGNPKPTISPGTEKYNDGNAADQQLNPLIQNLKRLNLIYIEDPKHDTITTPLAIIDPIADLVQNMKKNEVTHEIISSAAEIYSDCLRPQALSTWCRGIPHYYSTHCQREQLLLELLTDCTHATYISSSSVKKAIPLWKYQQLDLLCGRLSLPDLMDIFVPCATSKEGRLTDSPKINYADVKMKDGGLPGIMDALIESIKVKHWPGFTLPESKCGINNGTHYNDNVRTIKDLQSTPLLNFREVSNPNLPNCYQLNFRVLLLRSIQERLLNHVQGSKEDQPDPAEFDSSRCAETIALSDKNRTAKQHTAKQWGMVMAAEGCPPNSGIYEWAVRLDKCEKGHIFLGACTREASIGTYVGGDRHGWGLIGTRALWHNRSKVRGDYGDGYSSGSTVRIRLNTDSGALSFGVDDSDWGVAFDGLTQCGTLYPAVGLYQRDDQVTILPVLQRKSDDISLMKEASENEAAMQSDSQLSSNLTSDLLPFLRHSFSVFKNCSEIVNELIKVVSTVENTTSNQNHQPSITDIAYLLNDPVLNSILPPLMSSLCLLKRSNHYSNILAMQLLPWCIKLAKQLDHLKSCPEFLKALYSNSENGMDDENIKGLFLSVSGEWEIKSSAAGSIPAQQYRLKVQQDSKNQIRGESSGSISAVSLRGFVCGSKVRFLETWKQGGNCLVDGRLRADGKAFFGTYEDTKSHTIGSISGKKREDDSGQQAASLVDKTSPMSCINRLVILETIACLLAGKLSGSLIIGDHTGMLLECVMPYINNNRNSMGNPSTNNDEEDDYAMVTDSNNAGVDNDADESNPNATNEANLEEYNQWMNSPLFNGGLPIKTVKSHLQLVIQQVSELTKQSYSEQTVSGSSADVEWLDAVVPTCYQQQQNNDLPTTTGGDYKVFLSDLVASRSDAKLVDDWILRHVGVSPFIRVGGDVMKVARKSILATMIWHSGCTQEVMNAVASIKKLGLSSGDNSNVRPHERLLLIWRSAQRVIEWAIRAKMSFSSTYSIMASSLVQKSIFLLELEISPHVKEMATFYQFSPLNSSDSNGNSDGTPKVPNQWEDYAKRIHSEVLLQISRFLEASIRISKFRAIMLSNCCKGFLRIIGLQSVRYLLSGNSSNATRSQKSKTSSSTTEKRLGGINLPCAISATLQCLSPALRGQSLDMEPSRQIFFSKSRSSGGEKTALQLENSYYLGGLGGCGKFLQHDLRDSFESLYGLLASSLSKSVWASNTDMQLTLLNAWGIIIRADDHSFLSRVRIFRILQTILDEARGGENSATAAAHHPSNVKEEDKETSQLIKTRPQKQLVQAALKVVHLLAAQVAHTGEDVSPSLAEQQRQSFSPSPLSRKPSGPETLGKSVFNMLHTELRNALEDLRDQGLVIRQYDFESEKMSSASLPQDPTDSSTPSQDQHAADDVSEKIKEVHQYCFQICSLLFSVSGAPKCRSYLSSSRWLRLLLALVDSGTPAIQRAVLRLLRRLLPSVNPKNIQLRLEDRRPFACFDIDSEDDDEMESSSANVEDHQSTTCIENGMPLIFFLLDIIGSAMPHSATLSMIKSLTAESMATTNTETEKSKADLVMDDLITSDDDPGSLFDLSFDKISPLASEVVVLLRSLYNAPEWLETLNVTMSQSLQGIPLTTWSEDKHAIKMMISQASGSNEDGDGETLQLSKNTSEEMESWKQLMSIRSAKAKIYRRAFSALSVLGGYIEGLHVGGNVKILPRSGSSIQELAFRGARGTLVMYDSTKSAAEVVINGITTSQESANAKDNTKTGNEGVNNGSRPVRVPIEDLCAVSEIEANVGSISLKIGQHLCTDHFDLLLCELNHSIKEAKEEIVDVNASSNDALDDNDNDVTEEGMAVDEADDDDDEEGEQEEQESSTPSKISAKDIHEEIVKEEILDRLVLCLQGFRSTSRILRDPRFASMFIGTEKNPEDRLRKLFEIAVIPTTTSGLGVISYLEESWLYLWSRWYNLQRTKIQMLIKNTNEDCKAQQAKTDAAAVQEEKKNDPGPPSANCQQMMEMGFPREWCEIALSRCGPNLEAAINFCFEHSGDMERLLAQQKAQAESGTAASSSSKENSDRSARHRAAEALVSPLLDQLLEMGFPLKWCKKALRVNQNNVDAALTWILSNGEMLEAEDRREEEAQKKKSDEKENDGDHDGMDDGDNCRIVTPNPLVSVSGHASIGDDLCVEGISGGGFASVGARQCLVSSGKWYYEATLHTNGCIQIGWADVSFFGSSERGDGVGDGSHSWAYDGWRQQKWHGLSSPYGSPWKVGDVIGCAADADSGTLIFTLNGKMITASMGIAFEGIRFSGGLYPCASFNRRERLQFNLGGKPFKFDPPNASFKPILSSIWTVKDSTLSNVDRKKEIENGTFEDSLEENVEESYQWESRYFGTKEAASSTQASSLSSSSLGRSSATAALNQRMGISLSRSENSRGNSADHPEIVSDNDVYKELVETTRSLAILHARRTLLALLSRWPEESVGKFHLKWLSDNESKKGEQGAQLFVQFIKLAGSLSGQLSGAPTLFASYDSPFMDSAISQLLDGGASGRHALFLLKPMVRKAISFPLQLDRNALLSAIIQCIEAQILTASYRKYSTVAWDGSDAAVISGLIQLRLGEEHSSSNIDSIGSNESKADASSLSWNDEDALKHPNLALTEWLTLLITEALTTQALTANDGKSPTCDIHLSLFKAWSRCLHSASVCLKEKGALMLSLIVHHALPHQFDLFPSSELTTSSSSIDKKRDPQLVALLESFVQFIPIKRLIRLTEDRLHAEKQYYPVASRYLQSLVELVSTMYLAHVYIGKEALFYEHPDVVHDQAQSRKKLQLFLVEKNLKEVTLAREQKAVRLLKEKEEAKVKAVKLEEAKQKVLEDNKAAEEDDSESSGDSSIIPQSTSGSTRSSGIDMMEVEQEISDPSSIANDDPRETSIPASADEEDNGGSNNSYNEIGRAAAAAIVADFNMEHEDMDAHSISTLTSMAMASSPMLIGGRRITAADILLSRGNIASKVALLSSAASASSKRSSVDEAATKAQEAKRAADITDGNFVYPEAECPFDTSQLTPAEIQTMESAALGVMSCANAEEEMYWRHGHTPNILSDVPGVALWSGMAHQHLVSLHDNDDPNEPSVPPQAPFSDIPELKVGCKVIRGPDWKWRDQDGGEGSIGSIESVSPWSGIEGEGMSVRWPNDSLYTYRWGADGKYDLIHVQVEEPDVDMNEEEEDDRSVNATASTDSIDETVEGDSTQPKGSSAGGKIITKYPLPRKTTKGRDATSFGNELKLGVLVHLYEKEKLSDHVVRLGGLIEYPDYHGATARIVGEKNLKDGTMWFQELILVRGNFSIGWSLRFGNEHWQPGTKYHISPTTSENQESQTLTSAQEMTGSFHYTVVVHGVAQKVNGSITITTKQLFAMDLAQHHPSLKISNDGLTVTCSGGESRNLALGTVGFTSGIHYWEVKIDQAEFGSVFIGVCEKNTLSLPNSPHVSTSNNSSNNNHSSTSSTPASRLNRWHGWGFVNFRATYHNSTERIYGDHFNAGDTIGVRLDMDEGKIAFFMDGIKYGEHIVGDLGVAFDSIHGSFTGTGPSSKTLFPCIGMRKSGDQITLSNKWVSKPLCAHTYVLQEAVEVSTLIRAWTFGFTPESQDKKAQKEVSLGTSVLVESWQEWKRWNTGRWRQYPVRPKGVTVDFDTSFTSCIAVSTAAGLAAPYLTGDRVRISTSGGRELDQPEEALVLGVYRNALWYRTETQGNEGAEEGRVWAWYWTNEELMGLILIRRNGKDMTLLEHSANDENMHVSPSSNQPSSPTFSSLTERERQAQDSLSDFITLATSIAALGDTNHWTCERDMQVIAGMNGLGQALGVDAHQIPFSKIHSISESSSSSSSSSNFTDPTLARVSGAELRARCAVLRVVNAKISRNLFLLRLDEPHGSSSTDGGDHDHMMMHEDEIHFISRQDLKKQGNVAQLPPALTGPALCAIRRLLFTSTKVRFWDDLVKATTTSTPLPSDEYEDPREIRSIRINRIQAQPSRLLALPAPSDRLRRSVFGQLYREMRTWSASQFRRAYCGKGHGGQKRAFKVKFLGEGVNDYGGPYRAVFEQVVDELLMDEQSLELFSGHSTSASSSSASTLSATSLGLLPLLIPTPNRRSNTGSNQDKYLLNPSCGSSVSSSNTNSNQQQQHNGPMALELYRFLGKLIGTATRHGLVMGFDFPSVVWSPLAQESIACPRQALADIDIATCRLLDHVVSTFDGPETEDDFCTELGFTTHLSDGSEVELKPGGSQTHVSSSRQHKAEYVDLVTRRRLCESRAQLCALREGLASVLPMDLGALFTSSELEQLICGSRTVDVALLRECTEYDDESAGSQHVEYFWHVLADMSNDERTAFLRFVWARSRMPSTAKDFPMNFKIQAAHEEGARVRPDEYLPHAQTCFFSLSLPAYSSREILRTKLLFAIENSPNMDADVRLHNAEGWADA